MYNKDNDVISLKQEELQEIKDKVQESTMSDVNVIIVNKKERRRIFSDSSYGFHNQNAIMELTTQLSSLECKIFLYFMAKCNYGNIVDARLPEIAKYLGVQKNAVIKCTKNLCSDNVIHKVRKGREVYYIIDPSITFKGNTTERFALSELLESEVDLQIIVNDSNKLEVAIK
jgi:hypothetical protein